MTMKAIGNKKLNIYVNINICKNKTQKGKLIQNDLISILNIVCLYIESNVKQYAQ